MDTVTLFKYLGRVITVGGVDCPEVAGNLRNDRRSWTRISSILGREVADPKILGLFFKEV